MKLDRNISKDGKGKYALLNLRHLNELESKGATQLWAASVHKLATEAIKLLSQHMLVHWGNESRSDQFFVLKYRDKFAAPALLAYADAVAEEAKHMLPAVSEVTLKISNGEPVSDAERAMLQQYRSLMTFQREIHNEYRLALSVGHKIPD